MDQNEIRLRLVEAAARTPAAQAVDSSETARRVEEMARAWEKYVTPTPDGRQKLGLPEKR